MYSPGLLQSTSHNTCSGCVAARHCLARPVSQAGGSDFWSGLIKAVLHTEPKPHSSAGKALHRRIIMQAFVRLTVGWYHVILG